jgi:hypothetical protein
MSFFTTIENLFTETESDIVALVAAAKNGIGVVETDVAKALAWVAKATPQIAADLQTAETLIVSTGVATNPEVAAAIVAANIAVQGLNAFAASAKAGQSNAGAVIAGYVAVKQAQTAASSAAAIAANAPAPAKVAA